LESLKKAVSNLDTYSFLIPPDETIISLYRADISQWAPMDPSSPPFSNGTPIKVVQLKYFLAKVKTFLEDRNLVFLPLTV